MAPVFLFCFVFPISPFKCLANICITVLTGKSLKTTSAHANKPRIHFTGKKNNNNKKRPKNKNPKEPACARPPSPQSPSTRLPPRSHRGTGPPACALAAVGGCFCEHRHRGPRPANNKPSLRGDPASRAAGGAAASLPHSRLTGARGGGAQRGERSVNAGPLPAALRWRDFFLSVPLPDSFVARNAEKPVQYRFPSVL